MLFPLTFAPRSTRIRKPVASIRPRLECLEDRFLLSTFTQTNLVSDQPGVAQITDPNLVNAWGISHSPSGGAFWVSSNGQGVSTLYTGDVNGSPFQKNSLVVSIPGGAPSGQVYNSTSDFVVSNGSASGPAIFIFATENGQITGWNPSVPAFLSTQAQTGATVPGALFEGLAIANNGTANYLYATDFHNNQIDVFDKNFQQVHLAGSFTDPNMEKGFAPYGIQLLGGSIYVTYAKQDPTHQFDVPGAGHGFIDVFDTNGNLLKRLVSHTGLDSPWGLAMAPSHFGSFSNDLLVGNLGSGRIHVYEPTTGNLIGEIQNSSNKALIVNGLWGLIFGNGVSAGDTNTLYFTAGPSGYSHGLLGKITLNASPSASVVKTDPTLAIALFNPGAQTVAVSQPISTLSAPVSNVHDSMNGTGTEVGQTGAVSETHQTPISAMVEASRDQFFALLGEHGLGQFEGE